MTDEPRTDQPATEDAATATAPPEGEEKKPEKLHQSVELRDVGPCKKHIKVTVDRADINARLGEKFSELLAEDHDIAPLSSPNIDPANIQMPEDGPLVYEFEVEVRPQFDLPNYRGLKIRRPVHTFTDEEVAEQERRLLAPHGQVVPKPEGNAQVGDVIVADVTTRDGERVLSSIKESQLRVEKQLAFKDGIAEQFGEEVQGANAGDTRVVHITLSSNVADPSLRGKTV